MKLRLLVRPDCDRACPGCCNKQWDLNALPIATDFSGYSEIMLTGGEPMLDCRKLSEQIQMIRRTSGMTPLYLYTAKTHPAYELGIILTSLEGVTITLHKQADVVPFLAFADYVDLWKMWKRKSLRLNVFRPIVLPAADSLRHWLIKRDMEWIVDCPLPKEEVFMRLDHGFTPDDVLYNWTGATNEDR